MKDHDGQIIIQPDQIREEVNFYIKLYTSTNQSPEKINSYLENTVLEKKITPDDKTACEGLLTELECTNVVYRLKKNKSPELDGLCNKILGLY